MIKLEDDVRYKCEVTGTIFDAKIIEIIKGRPKGYVLGVKNGGLHYIGIIAYSNQIWKLKEKKNEIMVG